MPFKKLYIWLSDGDRESASFSYAELHLRARAIAAHLQTLELSRKRAVLLYGPGLNFIEALFGCLYAGWVAVPAYVPGSSREYPRIEGILRDSDCGVTLTAADSLPVVSEVLARAAHDCVSCATDTVPTELGNNWRQPEIDPSHVAYLQYTSGSTSAPKGVMVTHANVLANMESIAAHGNFTDSSVSVSWLPHFHDMGLIYGFLQPLFNRFPAVLLSPATFIHRPLRWLAAISCYRGTHCGGPNFAYDLCVERISHEEKQALNLSCWQVAFNGAEPVRDETLRRFATEFLSCGFRSDAFYPVYGLAEASLKVTSVEPGVGAKTCAVDAAQLAKGKAVSPETNSDALSLVSCGKPSFDHEVVIVDPRGKVARQPRHVGEIWVKGRSVAAGYWKNPEATRKTFQAFLSTGQGPYLRTGDLGFMSEGELFITGRRKDCIIIRGRNHYPQDIERTAEAAHPALRRNGTAVFSVERDGQERLVVVSELNRKSRSNPEEAAQAVRSAITQTHDIQAFAIVFIKSGSLPRTSSGKVQRHACKQKWTKSELPVVSQSLLQGADLLEPQQELTRDRVFVLESSAKHAIVLDYVRRHVAHCLHCSIGDVTEAQSLIGLGTDSLAGFELMHRIGRDLKVAIPIAELLTRNIGNCRAHCRAHTQNRKDSGLLPVQSTARVG